MLEALKTGKKAIGAKQSLRAVEAGSARSVFIARDAEEKVIAPLRDICTRENIEIFYVDTMKQLGKACGIEVGAAAVTLLK